MIFFKDQAPPSDRTETIQRRFSTDPTERVIDRSLLLPDLCHESMLAGRFGVLGLSGNAGECSNSNKMTPVF